MCGRFSNDDASPQAVAYRAFMGEFKSGQREAWSQLQRSFDVRPTNLALVLIGSALAAARWGWVRDFATSGRIINARWETATEKRTFAEAVGHRRCVIPATAYYEWRRDERDRPLEKYAFLPASGGWLAMAGLYEDVPLPEGVERRFLVLTRPMVKHAGIHDRTPVMLSEAAEDAWLDPTAPMGDVLDAARSMGDDDLIPRRVASGPTKVKPAGAWLMEAI
jgi:putative SOS response-associated peptidase YedK